MLSINLNRAFFLLVLLYVISVILWHHIAGNSIVMILDFLHNLGNAFLLSILSIKPNHPKYITSQ